MGLMWTLWGPIHDCVNDVSCSLSHVFFYSLSLVNPTIGILEHARAIGDEQIHRLLKHININQYSNYPTEASHLLA